MFLLFFLAGCLIAAGTAYCDGEDKIYKQTLVGARKTVIPFIISMLLFIFVPTKKDALLIWGVGGTIDYIKSNDTAKQLPDKCIQVLDKFVDEYMLNEEDNKEK